MSKHRPVIMLNGGSSAVRLAKVDHVLKLTKCLRFKLTHSMHCQALQGTLAQAQH
mgnify:CR=1 FL=1